MASRPNSGRGWGEEDSSGAEMPGDVRLAATSGEGPLSGRVPTIDRAAPPSFPAGVGSLEKGAELGPPLGYQWVPGRALLLLGTPALTGAWAAFFLLSSPTPVLALHSFKICINTHCVPVTC